MMDRLGTRLKTRVSGEARQLSGEPGGFPAIPKKTATLPAEADAEGIVISTTAHHAAKVLGQARVLGIPAAQIGKVGGSELKIKTASGDLDWPLAELHDGWWNSIARAMAG